MKRIRREYRSLLAASVVLLLSGCDKVFDLTPYDAIPAEEFRALNAANTAQIIAALAGNDGPVTIGLTSDPHYHYSDLSDIVAHMKGDPTIDFVVVPGDLTDQALLGEFEAFAHIMQGLDVPWLALIGNHDHLGNGRIIYERMFGPRNVVMDVQGYRFILFDDTVWESNMPPDIQWLEQMLDGTGERVPIVISHIPPFTDQLAGVYEEAIQQRLADSGVPLFIHGHLHRFNDHEPYGDGVRYHCVPWPEDRSYSKITLDGGNTTIEHIRL